MQVHQGQPAISAAASGPLAMLRSLNGPATRLEQDWRGRPVLTVEEAGRLLGLGRTAAYAAVARGDLPVLRLGRRMMVPTARLRAMLGEPVD